MTISTVSTINHLENNLKSLHQLGQEVNLEDILMYELNQGLPSDINNCA